MPTPPADDVARDEADHDRVSQDGWIRGVRRAWADADAGRRRFVLLGVVLTAIGLAVAIWWGLASTVGKPAWRDLGYRVVDPSTTYVRFEVTRPPSLALSCVVEAQETSHGVVGRTTVQVPPGEPASVVVETRVRTTSTAVYGAVRRCAAA
ncbi:DUF4307 domain-containing protein [Agilicoccus flavus]|uniref:DUF4307 domain-containing protein n=1 Tax=Agilicoccus flavus TaxID=2775968 RepID=UPI001CF6B458|nr:DUF4307 domain-containing protein [Agilicoccus flavus]